jgi:hypothetical protein
MKNTKLDGPALLWLGLGATLLALVAMKDPITRLQGFPDQVWNTALISGAIFSVLGIVLGVSTTILNAKQPAQGVLEHIVFRRRESPRFVTCAQSGDLRRLHDCYEDKFGKDVPSVELMNSWLNRCETAFALIYTEVRERLSVKLKLVGSFKLLPLTKQAVEQLEGGRTSGSTFEPEHICAPGDAPAAFYVGDLFAEGSAGGAVLYYLDAKCRDLLKRGLTIYARPFTAQGRRVMMNRGFVQVSNGKEELEMRQLCRLAAPPSLPGPMNPT